MLSHSQSERLCLLMYKVNGPLTCPPILLKCECGIDSHMGSVRVGWKGESL
jgi:hypothetical protein